MLWRTTLAVIFCVGPCFAVTQPLDVPPLFLQGLRQLRNGRFHQAIETSNALKNAFPQHPLSYLIAAEAYQGMIYCQTGHITSEQIWNVAESKTSYYDKEFFGAVEGALYLSHQMRQKPDSAATGAFYAGLARAARARLYALRGQRWKAASEAKQMRSDLLGAIAQDSELAADAYLALGAYNYYADVLSPLLKVFRFLLRIPGGDRKMGIEQLQTASEHVGLFAEEARYELARIYSIRENRPSEALLLFGDLAERYPENALYALAAGQQAERFGEESTAITYYQKATDVAGKMEAVCRKRLGNAAAAALERLRGNKAAGEKSKADQKLTPSPQARAPAFVPEVEKKRSKSHGDSRVGHPPE